MRVLKIVYKGLFLGIVTIGSIIMNFIGAIICAVTEG